MVFAVKSRGRGRGVRWAKWAGLVLCLLIAGTWAVNYWWTVTYSRPMSNERVWFVGFGCGIVYLGSGLPDALLNGKPPGLRADRNAHGYYWTPRLYSARSEAT